MKKILLYLWQLPQNLVGLATVKITDAKQAYFVADDNTPCIKAYCTYKIRSSVSLGDYIILKSPNYCTTTIKHEYGHQRQSLYLGWFYLPVIGLFSGLHNVLCKCRKHSYYSVWTERWADDLGGVERWGA